MPQTNASIPGLVIYQTNENGHVMLGSYPSCGASGSTMDTTTLIYGIGCMIMDRSSGVMFRNTGTAAAPVWSLVDTAQTDPALVQKATVDISAADIVGTGAGQFGHANGYILVPAPGAGKVLSLLGAVLNYKFATAAYTLGGNITINIGGGGAAITGLISAANSVGAAADKIVQFIPLAAAAANLTANTPLNLVSSAAFTQPGTAAGTIRVHVRYRVLTML